MKKLLLTLLTIAFLQPFLLAAQRKTTTYGLTVAGTTEGNVGCVILEKHMPVKGKLLFVGVLYARTEYRVLQTFNYKPARQKYTGSGQIKELNHNAVKDKIKLVVVPSKYSQEQLQDAQKLCKK
ncbi:MAG: hypothetical protein ACRD3O_11670 [Terriglobia bacterium]